MAGIRTVWLALAALLVISMAACASRSKWSPTSAAQPDVLFADDFDAGSGAWSTWEQPDSAVVYYAGGLRARLFQPNLDLWSRPGERFADARIEISTARLSGPQNNQFGIVCRYRNGENFYSFLISSDGYYGIARVQDGEYSLLSADALQFSALIHTGDGVNQLRADCVGHNLALWVNGEQLAHAQDGAFPSGEVGLIAGSFDEPGVDIFFDNFIVMKPE